VVALLPLTQSARSRPDAPLLVQSVRARGAQAGRPQGSPLQRAMENALPPP